MTPKFQVWTRVAQLAIVSNVWTTHAFDVSALRKGAMPLAQNVGNDAKVSNSTYAIDVAAGPRWL